MDVVGKLEQLKINYMTEANKLTEEMEKKENDFMTRTMIPILKGDPVKAISLLDQASHHYLIGGMAVANYAENHMNLKDANEIREKLLDQYVELGVARKKSNDEEVQKVVVEKKVGELLKLLEIGSEDLKAAHGNN